MSPSCDAAIQGCWQLRFPRLPCHRSVDQSWPSHQPAGSNLSQLAAGRCKRWRFAHGWCSLAGIRGSDLERLWYNWRYSYCFTIDRNDFCWIKGSPGFATENSLDVKSPLLTDGRAQWEAATEAMKAGKCRLAGACGTPCIWPQCSFLMAHRLLNIIHYLSLSSVTIVNSYSPSLSTTHWPWLTLARHCRALLAIVCHYIINND